MVIEIPLTYFSLFISQLQEEPPQSPYNSYGLKKLIEIFKHIKWKDKCKQWH